jgi:hypothetical protein
MGRKAKLATILCEPLGEGIIAVLDEIRDRAERGEISSVTVAYVTREGCAGHLNSKLHSVATMLGSLALAQGRLVKELSEP